MRFRVFYSLALGSQHSAVSSQPKLKATAKPKPKPTAKPTAKPTPPKNKSKSKGFHRKGRKGRKG
jgi:hypothetical protein